MARKTLSIISGIPPLWRERFEALGRLAENRGLTLCLVGGSVRDLFLKRTPLDWDVVGEGDVAPLVQEAAKRFSAGVVEHPAFLTYTLHFRDGTSLDVATSRREIYERPAALPTVRPAKLRDDFQRRDFAVNAMAIHLTPRRWGELADPLGGLKDLEKKIIRVLHNGSFQDDPTRIYRAARYAGRCGYKVEPNTLKLIKAAVKAKLPALLSPARRRNELECLLRETDARAAMKLLWSWGLWFFWEKKWKWSRSAEKFLAPHKSSDLVTFRLMGLCASMPPDAARKSLASLAFPRFVWETVSSGLECRTVLKKKRLPKGSYKRLSPVIPEFLLAAGISPDLLDRWSHTEPVISGMDLSQWGYPPGPLYQEIFNALRLARWRDGAMSFDGEKRFVFDNYPLKK